MVPRSPGPPTASYLLKRQYSIALRYLPTLNLNLYSPSLFSSSGGTYSGTFLDMDDTKLNMSLSYSFDTQLRTWNNYRDSKDEYEQKQRAMVGTLMEIGRAHV